MHSARLLGLAAVFAGGLSAQQVVFHVTDLGSVTGTVSFASGISQNGNFVTGSFNTPGGAVNQGFVYTASTGAVAIGTLGGVSIPSAVNNTGQVSGNTTPSQNEAFLYSNGTMMGLGYLGTGPDAGSFGQGLNNLGQVVGYSQPNPSTNFHQYDAFLYSNGTMQDLGFPSGALGAYAAAINDNGLIVGYYEAADTSTHAFSLMNGKYTDLGTLPAAASFGVTAAIAVSANGLIAGTSGPGNGASTHAFLYANGVMTDLGTLGGVTSRASGVNSNGDVVGYSTWSGSGFHGFLYHNGTLYDLNNLLDAASSGYTITQGVGSSGISELGNIAATGVTPGGATHALLLTPVNVSSQTLSFDPIANQILGIAPFPVAAQSSSGLPVTITSSTPAVCSNSTNVVMLLSTGTCTLTASQPGSISYSPATPVTHSFLVSMAGTSGTLTPSTGNPFSVGTEPRGMAVGDFNGDGFPDLAVANYASGNVTVLLGSASAGLNPATGSPVTVGTNPQAVAVGDFNGDGFQDLAVANSGSNNLTILLGNGHGGFTATSASPITVGLQPVAIAVGDFNGDGMEDLAVANFAAGNVTVLLGNGQGAFSPATGSPLTVGTNPLSIAVADFNGDGYQDLAVANFGSNNLTVLLGSAGGTFAPATNSPLTVGSGPYSVTAGDVTGDGKPDLAVANLSSNNVTVLIGDGTGKFNAPSGSPFPAGTSPYSVVVADLNGDGLPDLATANYGSNNLSVLLGNGQGGFTAAAGGAYTVGNSPFSLVVADFNGDGISDLATANYGGGNVSVLLGGKVATTATLATISPLTIAPGQTVPFTFTVTPNSQPFYTPTGAASLLDGSTTIGTASQNGSPYSFSTSSLTAGGSHAITSTYAGDTHTVGSTSNTITIQVNTALTAQTISFGPLANLALGFTVAPLSGTATSGLMVQYTSNTMAVCMVSGTAVTLVSAGTCSITASQPGNGTYAAALPVTVTFTVLAGQTIAFDTIPNQIFGISPFVTAAKSNAGLPVTLVSNTPAICSVASNLVVPLGAGSCSITASQPGSSSIGAAPSVKETFTVIRSLGAATLTAAGGSPFTAGSNPNSVAVGDVNGDGNPDLLVANRGANNVTVLLGNGKGGFSAPSGSPFTVGNGPFSVAVGDFNVDGVGDFATANFTDGTVSVMLGNSQGGFTAATGSPFTVGKQPGSIAVGDFNDDGVPDLAVANQNDGTVSILLGSGNGGFTPAMGSPFPAGASADAVAVGDFNNDGIQDLVITDEGFSATTAVVLLGNGSGGFTAATGSPFNAGFLPTFVAVGDFNGDGVPDFAAPNVLGGVSVLLGVKGGGFTVAASPSTGAEPFGLTIGDFNGDGIPDIATANTADGTVTLLLGNGIGGFAAANGSPLMIGGGPSSVAVGDFNKDGIEDLAVANNGGSVTVLLGGQVSTTSVLSTTASSPIVANTAAVPLSLAVSASGSGLGALTGTATFYDGSTVLGTATQSASPYTFTANLGPGSHSLTATFNGGGGGMPSTSNAIAFVVLSPCDLNQDGKTDIKDVQMSINQAQGALKPMNDLDGSGSVNVVDNQIVINAAAGLQCSAKINF